MSTALAIAGVTQVLRDLLNDRFVNQNVAGTLGQSVTVSTLPPDRVVQQNGVEVTQLNLFLRQVTPNLGWRNEGLPSRDNASRTRLSNPPLALNLHYLISAHGAVELHAEILLGYAMQMLHENPVIPREAIRRALQPPPDAAGTLPPWLRSLADSGLQSQLELLRITPQYLSTEDMSKFWTSTLAHYRPSAAYEVSVVLIQAEDPVPNPLPVLVRNFTARPSLAPSLPTLSAVVPEGSQNVVELGTTVALKGFELAGTPHEIRLINDRFGIEEPLAVTGGNATELQFKIPADQPTKFPAGIYRVAATVKVPGETVPRVTNELALIVAPKLTNLPPPVTRAGTAASFTLEFVPEMRPGQTARLMLGGVEYAPEPFTAPTSKLSFVIPKIASGDPLAQLRIDGIDSVIVNPLAAPPAFFDRRVVIP